MTMKRRIQRLRRITSAMRRELDKLIRERVKSGYSYEVGEGLAMAQGDCSKADANLQEAERNLR